MSRDIQLALQIVAKDAASGTIRNVRAGIDALGDASTSADNKGGFGRTREGLRSISEQLDFARKLFIGFQAAKQAAMGVGDVASRSDAYASYTARLRLATASQSGFSQALADTISIANQTQAPVEAVANLYTRLNGSLRELGKSQSLTRDVSEAVALSLKVSGAGAAETGSAVLQLSQAFASGVLRGDEFNSVNEAAPRLMKALADGLDVPVGRLRKMAEAGELTAEVMANELPKALEQLRSEADQIPPTIGGAVTQLYDAYSRYIGETAQATGLSKGLAKAIQTLAKHFDVLGDAVISLGVGAMIAGLVSGITVVIGLSRAAGVATVSLGAMRVALAALSATPLGAFLTLAGTIGAIVFALGRLKDASADTAQADVANVQAMADKRKELESRLEALVGLRTDLEKDYAKAAAEAAEEASKAAIKSQKDTLDGQKKSVAEQIQEAERLGDALKKAWDEAGEKARKYREEASGLRQKAQDQGSTDQDAKEDRQLSRLDKENAALAQQQRIELASSANLEAYMANLRAKEAMYNGQTKEAERQLELANQAVARTKDLAAGIQDAFQQEVAYTAAAEASRATLETQAAIKEKQADQAEQDQAALAQQQKDNAQRVADLQTQLADLEAKLKALDAPKTVKVEFDQGKLEQVKSDIAAIKAELDGLERPRTASVSVQSGGAASIPGKAAGGEITGPGPKGRDSVLTWMAPNEHVWTSDEVDAAGGHGVMYALRAAIRSGGLPGFADGGALMRAVGAGLPRMGGVDMAPAMQPINITLPGLGSYPMQAAPAVAGRLTNDLQRQALIHGLHRSYK